MISSRQRVHRPTSFATSMAVVIGPSTNGLSLPRRMNMPSRCARRMSSEQSNVTMGHLFAPAHAAIESVLATPFGPTKMRFAWNAILSNRGWRLKTSSYTRSVSGTNVSLGSRSMATSPISGPLPVARHLRALLAWGLLDDLLAGLSDHTIEGLQEFLVRLDEQRPRRLS